MRTAHRSNTKPRHGGQCPPYDWTHEHRAVRLEQGIKYIATTWVVFA